jgi:DNA-binding NarL/FixJ family response regulator
LAGIASDQIAYLTTVLSGAGLPTLDGVTSLNIREVAEVAPTVLICDLDALAVDKLEQLRQLRFVLPEAMIAVYTGQLEQPWATSCHFAGASGILSKASSRTELSSGIRAAIRTGCLTDPRFRAAPHLR